jgi:uncharacterized protein
MNTEIYKWGKIALIMLVVFLGVTTLNSLKHLRSIDPAYNSITVSGEGEVFAVPDVASFSFSVSADATTVATAQAEVTKKMDAILKAMKDLGIEDKDVKTSDYSVWPKYTYRQIYCITTPCPGTQQVQDGYTASHTVTVKVRDTEKAGAALSAAGDAGATNLSGLTFTVDDLDTIVAEARDLAIKDAREKAEGLADDLGVRLVRVVSFSDSLGGYPQPYYARDTMGMGGPEMMASNQAKAPTLPMGENKAQVSVSITYEIR